MQFLFAGHQRHRERPFDRTDRSVERKLAHEQKCGKVLRAHAAGRSQDADRHREVESGTLFFQISGREVDGYMLRGQNKSAIPKRRLYALAALPDRRVREPDSHEVQLLP